MLATTNSIFNTITRAGLRIVLSFVFILGLAILLNWGFVILHPFVAKHNYISWWVMLPVNITLFGILIPYFYYLANIRFLPQIAINQLYKSNARMLFEYLIHKMFEKQEKYDVEELASKFQIKQLGGRSIRWIYAYLFKKAPWLEVLQEISQEVELTRENTDEIINRLDERSEDLVPLDLLKADYTWFYFYLLINAGMMALIIFFL